MVDDGEITVSPFDNLRLQIEPLDYTESPQLKAWCEAYRARMVSLLAAYPGAKIEECQSWPPMDEG